MTVDLVPRVADKQLHKQQRVADKQQRVADKPV
jgi:hypothetical protein